MLLPTRISIAILVLALFGSVIETHAAPLDERTHRAVERSVRGIPRVSGDRARHSLRLTKQRALQRERAFFTEKLQGHTSTRLSARQLKAALQRY